MITKEMALEKVQSFLGIPAADDKDAIVIMENLTDTFELGWVFFYQSKAFVETGNIYEALGGNAPIIVNKYDGSLYVTGTGHPTEVYIAEYLKANKAKYG